MSNRKKEQKAMRNRTERKKRASKMRDTGIHTQRAKVQEITGLQILQRIGTNLLKMQELTKDELISMIHHTINNNAAVGSLIEVLEIVHNENGHGPLIDENMAKLIENFDSLSVRYAENAEIIMAILSDNGAVKDIPIDLLTDTGYTANDVCVVTGPAIIDGIPKSTREIIEKYIAEHLNGRDYQEFMVINAVSRIDRVKPKYATPLVASFDEVVDPEDIEEINQTFKEEA